jgi:hypothetical protein
LLLVFAPAAWAAPARMPRPGALNSVQGQVTVDGREVVPARIRSEALGAKQAIRTWRGRAELLLTPGTYLRIGNHSEARLLSRSLENTRVRVVRGTALLEAEAGYKSDLTVEMDGTRTKIDKKGLYGFNASRKAIAVLHGKATVYDGQSRVTLKNNRHLLIGSEKRLRPGKLNKRAFQSTPLFRWSMLRNRYEAEAKRSVQRQLAQTGRWYGPGWYWSGFWGFYTYLPSAGWYAGPYFAPYGPPYLYGPWGWGGWGGGWWGDGDGDGI